MEDKTIFKLKVEYKEIDEGERAIIQNDDDHIFAN